MNVAISKKYLGTHQDFIWDTREDRYFWSSIVPENSWVLGDPDYVRDLGTVAASVGFKIPSLLDTPWADALRSTGADFETMIPWNDIIPGTYFKEYIKKTLAQLWLLIDRESDSYYMKDLISHRGFLLGLQKSNINRADLDRNLDHAKTELDKNHILSFSPDQDGLCKKTIYSQTSSSTGRLVVKSGPRILTIKKKYREMIKTSFKDGVICQVDLVSLEPRIALRLANKHDERDIYTQVSTQIFKHTGDREKAKIATISCLYGMSARSLRDQLPGEDATRVLSEIKDFFGIQQLKNRLNKQVEKDGFITNLCGRRIKPSSAIVNNYIQSTGVDVSLNCFKNLCTSLSEVNIEFKALFVVHDALIIDIKKSDLDRVKYIVDEGLKALQFKDTFPAKIEEEF